MGTALDAAKCRLSAAERERFRAQALYNQRRGRYAHVVLQEADALWHAQYYLLRAEQAYRRSRRQT